MEKSKKWLAIALLFVSFSCRSQSSSDLIIGTWQNVKKVTKDGRDTLFNGKKFPTDLIFEFTSSKFIDKTPMPITPPPVDYLVKDNILILNGRKAFYIEKLTENEMILIENNPGKLDAWVFRFVFRKIPL